MGEIFDQILAKLLWLVHLVNTLVSDGAKLLKAHKLVQVAPILLVEALDLSWLGLLVINLADEVLEALLALGHVGLENVLAVVASTTVLTLEGFIVEVAALVVLHVPLGSEALAAALGTDEGAFVFVDTHVDPEVLLLRECFTTAGVLTLKWLRAIVHVQVRVETESAGEHLRAALEGAYEGAVLAIEGAGLLMASTRDGLGVQGGPVEVLLSLLCTLCVAKLSVQGNSGL